ncbi:A/G-specific adenine glycosylase [Kytococcus sedentarius]|uniref:A/G-specific adenine glycosylase n=1 Tax=Kytococcus sedentarius TaxID=1276 RepID=UPI0035BBAF79
MRGPLVDWYARHARDLPWRHDDCPAWGVLVSEVMLQQTPVVRVLPRWTEWMERWPGPTELADAGPGEAVRAWGRLGYPRRALRLVDAATALRDHHGGEVPQDEQTLRSLPGIGEYTAAAVAAFAFGRRAVVVDTNIRRVQARAVTGVALPAPGYTAAERRLATGLLPADAAESVRWNVSTMELGALVCTARNPSCGHCPLVDQCAWVAAGSPPDDGPPRRTQAWAGTDRQARGRIVQALRDADGPLSREQVLTAAGAAEAQAERCLGGLLEDGLAEGDDRAGYTLPQ